MFPVFEEVRIAAPPTRCLSNLKQASLGMMMYDSDEVAYADGRARSVPSGF